MLYLYYYSQRNVYPLTAVFDTSAWLFFTMNMLLYADMQCLIIETSIIIKDLGDKVYKMKSRTFPLHSHLECTVTIYFYSTNVEVAERAH